MADPNARLLADCLAAAGARRTRAEAAHAASVREETKATAAADTAAAALARAAGDWTRQMAEGFDPTLGALLGEELLSRAAASAGAVETRRAADAARVRTAEDWRGEEARRRALEDQAATAIRRAARRTDERLLAILADRETFARSRR